MEGQVYELCEIPMDRPSIVYSALKFVNQQQLLDSVGQSSPYPRSSLLPVFELAVKAGMVHTERAHVPTKGILTFVDLASFPDEFDEFVQRVKDHELEVSETDLCHLLKHSPTRQMTLKRRILRTVTGNKWLLSLYTGASIGILPVAEKFCSTPEQFLRLAAWSLFRPSQSGEEICSLLNLLSLKPPRRVLEIGTNRGGTLYLFARFATPDAKLVSIDLRLQNPKLLSSFARGRQRIVLVEGDSTHPRTIKEIEDEFPDGIDFLLLDGDHSYMGIHRDYQNYASLVRPGGLVAFHDIVEDNESRYGVVTGGWAGGVPRFWQEIRPNFKYNEFVSDYAQDGQGIGVLFTPED